MNLAIELYALRCCQRDALAVQAVKLTSWLENKLRATIQRNMVFPACTDITLPFLIDEHELATPAVLPLKVPHAPQDKEKAAAIAAKLEAERGGGDGGAGAGAQGAEQAGKDGKDGKGKADAKKEKKVRAKEAKAERLRMQSAPDLATKESDGVRYQLAVTLLSLVLSHMRVLIAAAQRLLELSSLWPIYQ